jgi:glycosyltransferase involved in cell wall biosynthesis
VAVTQVPILYLAPWVDLGGSDKGTIDWFKHIDRGRWSPSLITTQPSPNRWLCQVESFAEEVWELPDLMPGASFPEFVLGFIESRGVRLVHIMNSRLGFDLLPDIACLPNPPAVVVQMHAEEPNQSGYVRYVTRRYGNLVDAFSVTSEHLKETVAAYEIAPSRIEVIHSGVDGKKEFNPERTEPLQLDGDGLPRVLWPGRLVEQKDPMLTLEVVARARDRGAEFVLDVVGDGYLEATVRARAEELAVADAIRWHPPSQEMPRWYRSADLLLMTSVFEGVPYVLYESLAMGVPVVAPALPGNAELMDSDSGVLVEPRDDADRYAEAIVDLLGDDRRRRSMGECSRERMLTEFSLEEMGRRHDELYERLLASRPAASGWRSEALLGAEEVRSDQPAAESPAPLRLPRDQRPERTIGVIVPCYRHGIFIDECIDSIKAQTLPPASIVVVDDGSDDPETIEALDRLQTDSQVRLLRREINAGPSVARNRALEELETSYVLPIDADDKLLPDALERMVAELEAAPEDVGFVYPHVQHIGNRSDYVRMPAYNLWLLMKGNYCPAPALFDRRVFAAGLAYAEDIVVGHEDWDLVLQLAERGVRGLHADGPTFLYRRQGFSRVNAVEYGPHVFQETIERRHPSLYGRCDAIKVRWAPALSILPLDDDGAGWYDAGLSPLSRQTCSDFELLPSTGRAGLQAALGETRGRWTCLLTPAAAPLLDDRSFVERTLYGFVMHKDVSAIVLAEAPGVSRHTFSQLSDSERLSARPVAVIFERPPLIRVPEVDFAGEDSILFDLAVGLQANGVVQWRIAPGTGEIVPPHRAPSQRAPRGRLDLNRRPSDDRSEEAMYDAVFSQAPRLPELTPGTVRRWKGSMGWIPPEAQLLCRYVARDGGGRIAGNGHDPPPGFEVEFDLGAVNTYAAPGARRLVQTAGAFELTDDQDELPRGRHGLGYVEQQPLPLLERLELRAMPKTGEEVLVAGPDDPLFEVAEPVATLGWIEAFPILPRRDLLHTGPVGVIVLRRQADPRGFRHRCRTTLPGEEAAGVALGSLYSRPDEDLVALRLRDDGRLATDLDSPGRASRDPRKISRWIAAPRTSDGRPAAGRRAAGARLRHLALHFRARGLTPEGGVAIGWLRREQTRGCGALFSATHPVTGDQLVTRSRKEALDLGYLPDGVLGYILEAGADRKA